MAGRFWYNSNMSKDLKTSGNRAALLREALHLQSMEGNPLSPDQISMFEMFEREGWPEEERIAHILERAKAASVVPAAE